MVYISYTLNGERSMSAEFTQIIKSLKSLIKAKGYTYKDLATHLDMSEAGIKRLMNAKDISFGRILDFCGFLEVSLEDLVSISNEMDKEVEYFTGPQIKLFEKSMLALKYYYKLRVEGLAPEVISEHLALSKKSNQKILSDLDRAELIKLLPGNNVAPFSRREVYWKDLGLATKKLRQDFTTDLISYFDTEKSKEGYYHIYHLSLSDQTREDLYYDLGKVIDEYSKRGRHERMALKENNLHPLNIAFILAPQAGFIKNNSA